MRVAQPSVTGCTLRFLEVRSDDWRTCEDMNPYENQLLGAFLFALGYEGGWRKSGLMPANLFQQTPLDRAFSDLVVGSDMCLALEFKRTLHEVSYERRKWPEKALASFVADQSLLKTSHRAHWVVYGRSSNGGTELRVCLYSDALIESVALDRGPAQRLISDLYDNSREPDTRLGVPASQLLSYLRAIAALRGTAEGGRATDKGAWLAAIRKNDHFHFVSAESLEQLLEPRRDMDHKRHDDQELERERTKDLGPRRRGPSR